MTQANRAEATAGTENPYAGAYPFLPERRAVWAEIVRYVARDLGSVETLLELGAGYCDFVNQYPAKQKLVFDLNPEMQAFAAPDVDWRLADARAVEDLPGQSADLVFASNFFEHLDADAGREVLDGCRSALRPGGRIALIQPNHRRCADHYFDDPTHVTLYDDHNIGPWLEAAGFRVTRLEAGLLPFSMQSRAPKWPWLVRAYLNSPVRPWAAQLYVVAEVA
ncbi:MAG: class I SAM-dependent methyltransferase [Myxococcota bacterium]